MKGSERTPPPIAEAQRANVLARTPPFYNLPNVLSNKPFLAMLPGLINKAVGLILTSAFA